MTQQLTIDINYAQGFYKQIKERSDRLINFFLVTYFLIGIAFAFFYGTWLMACAVGGLSLTAYYSAKLLLPESNLYQYVLGSVLGVFMAQFIYQMHGLFEMHFFAFIGSAILITYQKWKLQIPVLIVVFLHHTIFSYLQDAGFTKVYFTQLNYFDLQTFAIHLLLTVAIIFISGLWAYQLHHSSAIQISQTVKMAELQQETQLLREREIKEQALQERNGILESIGDAFFAVDKNWTVTYWNNIAEQILHVNKATIVGRNLWEVFPAAVNTLFYIPFDTALKNNIYQQFEASYHNGNDWYETSIYPSENGLTIYIKDISQRKSSEIQLKKLNEELKEQAKELEFSNAELEQFAYVASHDLQEPLRMVTSFMGQLERKYSDVIDDKGKQYINFAIDGGKRMRQIILDLLSYSRVGRTGDKLEEVDINATVAEIIGLFRKKIEENAATLTYDNLPNILSFRAPLRQVFQNLIGNALKYQQPGRQPIIHVAAKELTEHWQFSVSDNGMGIDNAYFEKIFIIFQRLNTGQSVDGTGLGLAVTKKTIEHLGGKITVASEYGKGSIFTFTILKNQGSGI